MTSEDQRERENMMIKDLTIKPLGKDMTYREGKVARARFIANYGTQR